MILNKIFLSGKIKIIRFGVMWKGGRNFLIKELQGNFVSFTDFNLKINISAFISSYILLNLIFILK